MYHLLQPVTCLYFSLSMTCTSLFPFLLMSSASISSHTLYRSRSEIRSTIRNTNHSESKSQDLRSTRSHWLYHYRDY